MRIDEFEFRNKQGEEIEPTKDQLVVYIKSLHKEIKTLNKALELACEEIVEDEQLLVQSCLIEGKIWDDEGCEEFKKFLIKDFKSQAKEMLKSE